MDKNMENNFSPYMNFDIGADPLLAKILCLIPLCNMSKLICTTDVYVSKWITK